MTLNPASMATDLNCEMNHFSPKKSYSAPSESEIDDCIYTATEKHKTKLLGKGEQGAAYEFDNLVIKITNIKKKISKNAWKKEVCIAEAIGKLSTVDSLPVGPKIHRHFICGINGFIVMDRIETMEIKQVQTKDEAMDDIKKDTSKVVRYKILTEGEGQVDNLNQISPAHQLGFVRALETMIDNGYIHMDNHIENLGFMQGHPIVFDFGFTQHREKMDPRWALCFSIFQILEFCPTKLLDSTELYRVATACLNDTYQWGTPSSGKATPLKDLSPDDGKTDVLAKFKIMAKTLHEEKSEVSPDLHLGSLVYAYIIANKTADTDQNKTADTDQLVDFVYLLRASQPSDKHWTALTDQLKRTATKEEPEEANPRKTRSATKLSSVSTPSGPTQTPSAKKKHTRRRSTTPSGPSETPSAKKKRSHSSSETPSTKKKRSNSPSEKPTAKKSARIAHQKLQL